MIRPGAVEENAVDSIMSYMAYWSVAWEIEFSGEFEQWWGSRIGSFMHSTLVVRQCC
jgi:hypothetical protein